jgi:hypothetical protein
MDILIKHFDGKRGFLWMKICYRKPSELIFISCFSQFPWKNIISNLDLGFIRWNKKILGKILSTA